jgi:hypothetical protein
MQAAALAAAKNYEKDALDRIRRIGVVSADLEVKGKHKGPGAAALTGLQGAGTRWEDGASEAGIDDYPGAQPQGTSSIAMGDQVL